MIQKAQAKNAKRLAELAAKQNAEAFPEVHAEATSGARTERSSSPPSDDLEIIESAVPDSNPASPPADRFAARFAAEAPLAVKEIGTDMCRAFILPKDRSVYDRAGASSACSELLGHITMVIPWATTVEQKVKDLDLQLRGLKLAEEMGETAEGQLDALHKEVSSKAKLRASRRAEKKAQKLVFMSEDQGFTAGYEEVIRKAHAAGMDYKLLLEEGMEDPIRRPEEPDVPPVVSSDPESDLSD
ncbi:hypothetical protein POM88_034403 [Heracleum sosnowskyi]|uniref:Uncharacterized protein n=1 Tax=Heracleum sosnowskyi TaxID=360622 RepID=A0AAD8MC72_9APIA|nr:hypothetical protein POM88_034403 [Heracleum sosnowskyi]